MNLSIKKRKANLKCNSLLVLTLVVLLALALAGCGDNSPTLSPATQTPSQQNTAAVTPRAVNGPNPKGGGTLNTPATTQETSSGEEEVLPVYPDTQVLDVPPLVRKGLGGWSGSLLMDAPTYQTYTVSGSVEQIVGFYTSKLGELDYIDASDLDSKVNGVTTHREDYAKKEWAVSIVIIGPLDQATLDDMTGEYPELQGKINSGTTIMVVAKDRNPVA